MYNFNYQTASSAEDASAKVSASDEGKLLAGGMTLLPTMKQRLAMPSDLIDLSRAQLSGISIAGDVVSIGAMTTHDTVANSKEVSSSIPALAKLAGGIGDPAVRNRGT
ncbi:MAG: FAD binding domain-containing protein, partial [Rhodospirillales bacterium]